MHINYLLINNIQNKIQQSNFVKKLKIYRYFCSIILHYNAIICHRVY